jgi:hypothetical protein
VHKIDEKYRWYSYLEVFIERLGMTEKKVYKMNYIHSLNWLAYWDNKDAYITYKSKQNKNKKF